jgi:hypothetical protein
VFPEGELGTDVEGPLPVLFDVGRVVDSAVVQSELKTALDGCLTLLGNEATLLHSNLPRAATRVVEEHGKEKGGPWHRSFSSTFYGWEAERIVAVSTGGNIMELLTRARTHLAVVLVDNGKPQYMEYKKYFKQAADLGLIQMK